MAFLTSQPNADLARESSRGRFCTNRLALKLSTHHYLADTLNFSRSVSLSETTMSALLPNLQALVLQSPQPRLRRHVTASFRVPSRRAKWFGEIRASVSASPEVRSSPDELVTSILSKVRETDRGVSLTKEQHMEVSQVAKQLQSFCVQEPVKCPLIFGDWDVVYCSNPTSPGGGFRSAFGRMFFKANEMTQAVETPDVVRNKVSFSLFGVLDGEVSLKGKLNVLDSKWIQVIFEPPELRVGALEFQYGDESEVKLQITYIDENVRLGLGSRGSLFVFQRRK